MADEAMRKAGGGRYFVVGTLVVAALAIGFVAFGSRLGGNEEIRIIVDPPGAELPKN